MADCGTTAHTQPQIYSARHLSGLPLWLSTNGRVLAYTSYKQSFSLASKSEIVTTPYVPSA